MSNWILLAGLIIIEFTIIAVGIVVCRKIEEYFGEVLPVYKEMCDCYERTMKNIDAKFESLHKVFNSQKDLLEKELNVYRAMNDHVKSLGEQHKKLLDCWRSIEGRYSEIYEQFAELNELMQKFQIDIPQNVIDQIKERIEGSQIFIDPNAVGILDPFYQASKFTQSIDIPAVENPYEIHAEGENE